MALKKCCYASSVRIIIYLWFIHFHVFLELVGALVDAAFDKKADVRNDMKCSLQNLGLKQPELVLTSCNVYLTKHQKVEYVL